MKRGVRIPTNQAIPMHTELVIFDLDGTLTDSGPGIMKAGQYALRAFGIEL